MSRPRTESVVDPVVEAMLADIDKDLRFVTRLFERLRRREADPKEMEALEGGLAAVKARRRDRSLYLALIGEFSSGKTTFINVLLGERLLKASALANTAAVTEIRQGRQRAVKVRFRGTPTELSYPSPDLQARLAELGGQMGTVEELLGELTANAEVAPTVERVTLNHPSSMLGDDIVVLDTPGINSAVAAHATVAHEVIDDLADAFVVLVPSHTPVSMRLRSLLEDHLRPYIHRTTFVVTHMDSVDEDERDEIVEFVRCRLIDELKLESPAVASLAVSAALRARMADPPVTSEDTEWLSRFEMLRAELVGKLRRERALAVAERVAGLLGRVMDLSEASLKRQAGDLQQRVRGLERHAPANLERFCTDTSQSLGSKIGQAAEGAKSKVSETAAGAEAAAIAAVRAQLDKATGTEQLDAAVAKVAGVVESKLQQVIRETSTTGAGITRSANQAVDELDRRFEERYRGLDRLRGSSFKPAATPPPKIPTAELTADVVALKEKLDKRIASGALGGAGVGAAIGTVILPVVGTLIGAGLGGLFGSVAGATGLDERRKRYWAELEPDIHASFESLRPRCMAALDEKAGGARSHLKARVEGYRKHYANVIRELEAAHAQAERDLQRQIVETGRDIAKVEARKAMLEQSSERLRQIGVAVTTLTRA